VSTLKIAAGATVPAASAAAAGAGRLVPNRRRAVFLPTPLSADQGAVDVRLILPSNSHFTEGTTSRWQANRVSPESAGLSKLAGGEMTLDKKAGVAIARLSREVVAAAGDSAAGVELETVVFYCSNNDDTCRTEADIWQLEVSPDKSASVVPALEHDVGSKRAGAAALI
jgi:hypothetical protein